MHPSEASRRVERFEQRGGDPRQLWSGVSEETFTAASREIARVTGVLLPSAGSRATLAMPGAGAALDLAAFDLAAFDLAAFGAAAFASGMGPLLGRWVEAGRLEVPKAVAELLAEHLASGRARARRLRQELITLLGLFDRAGIDTVVLKGMHTGWVYFPEPGTRPCSDIDLLIPPDRVSAAAAVLTSAGFSAASRLPERTTWKRAGEDAVVSVTRTHEENPWALDLHCTLDRSFSIPQVRSAFGSLTAPDVRSWIVDGTRASVLDQPLLIAYLAVHAGSHLPLLSMLRIAELVLVLRHDADRLAWQGVIDRLEPHGALGFAYPALKLAADLVPGTVPPEVLATMAARAPAAVLHITARTEPATALRLYRHSMQARFMWVETPAQRIAALLIALWPMGSDGRRLSLSEAVALRRLVRLGRRLLTGRFSWRPH